jgi:hypothetical protein
MTETFNITKVCIKNDYELIKRGILRDMKRDKSVIKELEDILNFQGDNFNKSRERLNEIINYSRLFGDCYKAYFEISKQADDSSLTLDVTNSYMELSPFFQKNGNTLIEYVKKYHKHCDKLLIENVEFMMSFK